MTYQALHHRLRKKFDNNKADASLPRRCRHGAAALLTIASLALASGSVLATGTTDPSHHPMRFDRISLEQGLSQSNVFSIFQDSDGLMWFGTESGLNSFNGYEFDVYRRDRGNSNALVSDYIWDVAEDANGSLWIASNGGGLALMDRAGRTFTSYRHDPSRPGTISSNAIRTLLADSDGSLWLGTRNAGIDHFDPATGEVENYRYEESAAGNEVFALLRDSRGDLWAGTNDGLLKLDTDSGRFERFGHDADDLSSLSGDRVRSLAEDSRGRIWVGTYGSGLNRFDATSKAFERFQPQADDSRSLSGNRVSSIFEDSYGRLWIGTDAGLNLFDRGSAGFVRFNYDSRDATSLGDDYVTTIFQDRSGILWVGTRNRGISKWNPRSWSLGYENARELTVDGDSEPNVTSFVESPAGTLWVGTFGDGLHAIDRATDETRTLRHDAGDPRSLSDDRVMSLLLDRAGFLWVGTVTGGLDRLNPATGDITNYRHDPENPASVSANGIMALFEDSQGYIWIGTYGGGANRLDPATGEFLRFVPEADSSSAISSNRVRTFAEDPSGKIWMGTDAGGLNLYDPVTGSFHSFRHDPEDPTTIADDTVYAVDVDAEGRVWVGTQGGGLDRVVGSAADPASIRFTNLSQVDGLTNDVIYGLEIADNGVLWLSTAFGISNYDPDTGNIRNLHRKDGLQSEEFNSGAHYKSAAGELFFGGPNGYNAFEPEGIELASTIPPVLLTGVFSGNDPIRADKPLDDGESIDISYRDDVVSFEFAALDYAAPERNQYRYKLEGFDKEWIELGNRRRVTYTDLNDGQYLLRVQAANADGVWNEAGLSLPVNVSPAPWDTWWAYLAYVALLAQGGAALWFAHQRKIRREEEYSNRLEDEVRERTEKLIESNQKLKELNHVLQESSLSDPLTGLRNRRFVFEEVSRDLDVMRRKLAHADEGLSEADISERIFMMIDLDNFKPINDTYGHAAGDQMLLEIRDVLLSTCRKSDFVIRWGGDEFVVIAKQAKPGEAEALAERIRSKIANHNFKLADGQHVRTTCSIGFSAYPLFRGQAEQADLDQILTLADTLMYEAKTHRNAWAGMLSPNRASTSFDFDHDAIDPTSLLFRAKRSGQLVSHSDGSDEFDRPATLSAAG